MPTNVGNLVVTVSGDVSNLRNALSSAEDALNKFNGVASRVVQLSELSSAADTTVASLQAVEFAAASTGLSLADLGKKAGEFNKNLEDEAKGVKKGLDALKLTFKDMEDLPFDERLIKIAEQFKALQKDVGDQKDALEKLGLGEKEYLLILQDGGETIKKAREEIQQYGIALDSVDAHAAAQAHRELDAMMKRFALTGTALWDQIAVVAAPAFDTLTRALLGTSGQFNLTEGAVVSLTRTFLGALDSMETAFQRFLGEVVNGSTILTGVFFALDSAMKISQGEIDKISWTKFKQGLDDVKEKIDTGVGFGELGQNLKKFDEYLSGLKERGEKAAEERAKIDKEYIEGEKGLTDEQKKALEARFAAIQQYADFEFSARQDAFNKRQKQLDDEKFLEVKSAEEIAALKLQLQDKYEIERQKMLFDRLESYYATEGEVIAAAEKNKLLLLEDALKAQVVTEDQYARIRVQINQKASIDIMQANAKMYTALANIVDTSLGQITALVDGEGKKQFTIFKAISVATALVKGYEAVVSAFAAGNKVGGPPVGFAFAAIAAAGVAAQIAKIVSTHVGSDSGAPTPVAGGSADGAAAAQALPNAGSTLTVQGINAGAFFSGEQIRDLASKLLQYQKDGGTVVLER
jgi:hypothetical protein